MTNTRKWISFLILASTGGIIFQVGYIRFVFLEQTYAALELTAQQYGNIISVYGIVSILSYFAGGWFADKFNPKALVALALLGTAICNGILSLAPGYWVTLIVHIVMAILGMGMYWSAMMKSISLLGGVEEQGRLFGYLEGVRGLISTIVGFAGAAIVAAAVVPAAGVITLIRVYGVVSLVLAILVWTVVKIRHSDHQDEQKVTLKQLAKAASNPYTWLIGGTVMAVYASYTALAYFSPLLQHQFGVGVAMIGVIGVIRSYVFQFIAGPIGGIVVDKVAGNTPRFLRWMTLSGAVLVAIFIILPRDSTFLWLALTVMFTLTFIVFMCRGVYFASVAEVGIPENERGGVIGLASGFGFLPDAFIPALAAWLIGDPTAGIPEAGGGYTTLFIFLLLMLLAGAVLTTITNRLMKPDANRRLAAQEVQ